MKNQVSFCSRQGDCMNIEGQTAELICILALLFVLLIGGIHVHKALN